MINDETKNRHLCDHYVLGECSLQGGGNHNGNCFGERNCINILLEQVEDLRDIINRIANADRIKLELIYNIVKCLRTDKRSLKKIK